MIHFKALLMAIVYLEAQSNPGQQSVLVAIQLLSSVLRALLMFFSTSARVSLYGFIKMPAFYFPWALLAMDLVMISPATGASIGAVSLPLPKQ